MFADYPFNPIYVLGLPLVILFWVGLAALVIYLFSRAISKHLSRRCCLRLPKELAQKVAAFPECSSGEHRVTLVLSDTRIVPNVIVASGAVKAIAGRSVYRPGDLDFDVGEIVDVSQD